MIFLLLLYMATKHLHDSLSKFVNVFFCSSIIVLTVTFAFMNNARSNTQVQLGEPISPFLFTCFWRWHFRLINVLHLTQQQNKRFLTSLFMTRAMLSRDSNPTSNYHGILLITDKLTIYLLPGRKRNSCLLHQSPKFYNYVSYSLS